MIAETDAEAEKLGLEAYATFDGHIHHLTRKAGRPDVHKTTPYDEDSWQRLIAGSPDSVLEKVQEDAARDRRELPAVHLLLRQPGAAGGAALAGAFRQRGHAEAQDRLLPAPRHFVTPLLGQEGHFRRPFMKAMVCEAFGGPEVLALRDVPDPPPPGAGEIQVRIGARGVQYSRRADARREIPVPARAAFHPGP